MPLPFTFIRLQVLLLLQFQYRNVSTILVYAFNYVCISL
jgi:hypothetical protein